MAKHTPAPWRYEYADGYCGEIIAANGKFVCTFTDEPSESDARLLAAAPELLEALIECERYGGGYTNCDQSYLPPTVRAQIQTAIAKARGEP
jgi:hypothetical protein